MQLLIFAKGNWMDVVDDKGRTGHERVMLKLESEHAPQKSIDIQLAKYARRYQKGDIVEVQPDGFRKNFNRGAFELVNVPGPVDKSLMDAQMDGGVKVKRRRFNVKTADVVLGGERTVVAKADLAIVDKSKVAAVG